MLVFREMIETAALRKKPLGGEKRINKLKQSKVCSCAVNVTKVLKNSRLHRKVASCPSD